MPKLAKLLVVDDEPFNLEIIAEHLDGAGYELVTANDGQEAWDLLQKADQDEFDALILDRMMPRMDGLTLLKLVKQEARFRQVPVIMQTAAASKEQVMEGIQNGAYYYLTKPFDGEVLATIVRAALTDRAGWKDLAREARQEGQILELMMEGAFRFRSLDDARALAQSLANRCPDPTNVGLGLLELLVNAVEHGNLGISTKEKARLLHQGIWEDEVRRRLELPENADKHAVVSFRQDGRTIRFHVKDSGPGFDWKSFEHFDPARAFEPNGRGIALARQLCFSDLEYLGTGSEVRFSVAGDDGN
ncbi:MAG: response regulator [Betaproteobacteria bacterium]|nr:response regulator [Betaproteobacteria bacterium]